MGQGPVSHYLGRAVGPAAVLPDPGPGIDRPGAGTTRKSRSTDGLGSGDHRVGTPSALALVRARRPVLAGPDRGGTGHVGGSDAQPAAAEPRRVAVGPRVGWWAARGDSQPSSAAGRRRCAGRSAHSPRRTVHGQSGFRSGRRLSLVCHGTARRLGAGWTVAAGDGYQLLVNAAGHAAGRTGD